MQKNTLNVGHLSTAYHTSFILMESDDLKNDLNLGINWILFGTGPEMVQAFKEEKLDIGYMGLPPAIIGIDKGIPIKCIAGGHVEGTLMIAKQQYKRIDELKNDLRQVFDQFIGKSIGVPSKGSIHDVILNYYLKKYSLQKKIDVRNYPQAEYIALDMKKGNLEGGVGTPALAVFTSTVLKSHIIVPPNKFWKHNPSYGIFCSNDLIKNQKEIILKFLAHHKKASLLIKNNPLLASEIIVKNFEMVKKNYINSVLEISPKYCIALSKEYVKASMNIVKILYELGYIQRKLKIEEIFNFEFIKKVHPEHEHY